MKINQTLEVGDIVIMFSSRDMCDRAYLVVETRNFHSNEYVTLQFSNARGLVQRVVFTTDSILTRITKEVIKCQI